MIGRRGINKMKIIIEKKKKSKKKGDRCTRIAKRKYDVWPSAYASGAVVKCRQGKIWKDLKEEMDLITEVSYEDSLTWLDKNSQKYIKALNYDAGREPNFRVPEQAEKVKQLVFRMLPNDIPDDNKQSFKGSAVVFIMKQISKDKEINALDPDRAAIAKMSRGKGNLETYFQFYDVMDKKGLEKIVDYDDLSSVISGASKAIEKSKEKKQFKNANFRENTDFFEGNYKFDSQGIPLRDEEGLVDFERGSDGWVIAAAHDKAAACLLGKKTNWCTAAPGLDYFKQYYGGPEDPLFYIHTPNDDRYQFSYGSQQFMDVDDVPVRGEDFQELHQRLKDAIFNSGKEDEFPLVMEYQVYDLEGEIEETLEAYRGRIDNPKVRIEAEAGEDYDEYRDIWASFRADFSYAGDLMESERAIAKYYGDEISQWFSQETGVSLFGEDDYGSADDRFDISQGGSDDRFDISEGGYSFIFGFLGHNRFMGDKDGVETLGEYFSEIETSINDDYEELRQKFRVYLVNMGILQPSRYDLLFNEELRDQYDLDDEDEQERFKEMAFVEESDLDEMFDNFVVTTDDETGEILLRTKFELPGEINNYTENGFLKSPKNKHLPVRLATEIFQLKAEKQPDFF